MRILMRLGTREARIIQKFYSFWYTPQLKCIGQLIFHLVLYGRGSFWKIFGGWDRFQGSDHSVARITGNNPALLSAPENKYDTIMIHISNIFLIFSYYSSLETK
jgi:hypothetical protein